MPFSCQRRKTISTFEKTWLHWDVRFSPTSEVLSWRQIYLKALLREKYYHVAPLGSRAFRDGKAQIQNLDLGIKILVSFNANAVLMCECADFKECHRRVIAEELRRRGFDTEELESWNSGGYGPS